jgi:tripartite ATP-independent transporter DctP family solute receptor
MQRISVKIFTVCLVLGLAVIFSLPAGAATTLKLGHNSKQDQPTGKAALKFAEIVGQKTKGEIVIQVFPDNQLGNNRQLVESLKMGALDICTMGLGTLGNLDGAYNMMQIPYVFRSQEHIRKVVKGPIGEELKNNMAEKNGVLLISQSWDRMVRHVGGRKPIRGLEDLKGYKVRAGVLPPIAGFKALGASPVSIPLPEMYVALQQGVADGAELPIDYFYEYSIYEVAKYLNLTYHTYGTQFLAFNKRVWDGLKPEHKKAIQEANDEAEALNNKLSADLEEDYLKKLKDKGMEFVKTDVDALTSALAGKIPEIAKNWPGTEELYQRIQAVK